MKTDEYPSAVVKVDSFENVLDVQDQIKSMGLSSYSMAETIQQMQESSKSLQLMLGASAGSRCWLRRSRSATRCS